MAGLFHIKDSPNGVLPWHAVCASKVLLAAVRDGSITVQNLRAKLNDEGGFHSVSLKNYGLDCWTAKELPLTSIDIDLYVSCVYLTWYCPDNVWCGFDENKINMLSTVCEKLISYNRTALKELKFDLSGDTTAKAFDTGIRVIPGLQSLTNVTIRIPISYKLSLSAIKCLTVLTSLSYSGYTAVRSEDKTMCVLFDFLSTKLETLTVHDYVDWMCADVIHPFVVSAFATRVSADGFAALRVLEYTRGESYLEPTSLRTFLDIYGSKAAETD